MWEDLETSNFPSPQPTLNLPHLPWLLSLPRSIRLFTSGLRLLLQPLPPTIRYLERRNRVSSCSILIRTPSLTDFPYPEPFPSSHSSFAWRRRELNNQYQEEVYPTPKAYRILLNYIDKDTGVYKKEMLRATDQGRRSIILAG